MKSKLYVFCTRHDENLLALHQEAYILGIELIPIYINKIDTNTWHTLLQIITNNDYLIVLGFPFGSNNLSDFLSQFQYKKCLNNNAFKQKKIGSKLYQQQKIQQKYTAYHIPTCTVEYLDQKLSFPLICKPDDGSCGQNVKLIHSTNDISDVPDNYIFQPFIPNDGDWRVVVVNNKAISAIKRLGKVGQTTNNIATGNFAVAEKDSNVLQEIYTVAEIASKTMGFDYVGVDVIKDINTNKYYFLESNERPTFETSQILTGVNIAKKIIDSLIEK